MRGSKLFLGIDGGGTKSTAIVTDDQGHFIASSEGASINFYSVGMDNARHHLQLMMDKLYEKTRIDEFDTVFIGMSALNEEAEQALTDRFARGIVHARSIYMHSDSYIALMALTNGKPGILFISGTGSMGIAVNEKQEFITIGGWGYLLGDQGSAYDIGIKGIKAAITAYERWGRDTKLIASVKRYFQVNSVRDIIHAIYSRPVERQTVANFAKEVALCANEGDPVAKDILMQAAYDLFLQAEVLIRQLHMDHILFGVYGGVFQNNDIVFRTFKKQVEDKYRHITVTFPSYSPEIGAIFSCFAKNNIPLDSNILNNLRTTIPQTAKGG